MSKNFLSGGVQIATDVYEPTGVANHAVIILVYGSDGLIDNKNGPWATMIGQDAGDLARKGFHAVVPDYFLRTGTPAGSIDYEQGGVVTVMALKDKWEGAIADALTYARTIPGIDASRVGLLGYSLGGYLTLRLRTEAKAIVAFFPPWLDGLGAATTPGLPVDIHYGEKDFLKFESNTRPIVQTLRTQGATVGTHCYPGASHGFSGSDAPNTKARAQSKTHMSNFFSVSL